MFQDDAHDGVRIVEDLDLPLQSGNEESFDASYVEEASHIHTMDTNYEGSGVSDLSCPSSRSCSPALSEASHRSSCSQLSVNSDNSDLLVLVNANSDDEEEGIAMSSELSVDGHEGNIPLYHNSSVTLDQAILNLMSTFIRHRWSKGSLESTLKLYQGVLPTPNVMPTTYYKLVDDYLFKFTPPMEIQEHYYYHCEDCAAVKSDETQICKECSECNSVNIKHGTFFNLSIADQLRFMFENRQLAAAIEDYQAVSREEGKISDIRDGAEFIEVKKIFSNKYDVTFMWTTDGVRMVVSSKRTMWAVLAAICEVHPKLRASYTVVCCIWVDHVEPDMNVYLRPFVDSLKDLADSGVNWSHPKTKEVCNSKVCAPVVLADAPARAKVIVMENHNSKYGCNVCEQKGRKIDRTPQEIANHRGPRALPRLRRFVYQEDPAPLRTAARMDVQAREAERIKFSVKGIVGSAVISELPQLDRGKCILLDYMHMCLLGVVSMLMDLWLDVAGDWNISNHIDAMDTFLLEIKIPDYMSRLTRSLRTRKFWKASEFRAWLLFYSLPCLKGILPHKYYQHYLLLVSAVFTLLKTSISIEDYIAADAKIKMFVMDMGRLYRFRDCVYNVHCLLHLVLCVKRWGPLWNSTFLFEDLNGKLVRLIHGTKNIGKELIRNIRIAQAVQTLKNNVNRVNSSDNFSAEIGPGVIVLTGAILNPDYDHDIVDLLNAKNALTWKCFKRAKCHTNCSTVVYTSRLYDSDKKRGNSCIQFQHESNTCYGQILFFIREDGSQDVLCIVEQFTIDQAELIYHEESAFYVEHLMPTRPSGVFLLIPMQSDIVKLPKVGIYLCQQPNTFENHL